MNNTAERRLLLQRNIALFVAAIGIVACAVKMTEVHSPVTRFLADDGGHRHLAELGEEFESEARDPEWSPHAEAQLEDYMARHPYPGAYREQWIECRQTLCLFYAEIDTNMAHTIQQSPVGGPDPFAAIQHESISQSLEQLAAAFQFDGRTDRIAMLATFRRAGAE